MNKQNRNIDSICYNRIKAEDFAKQQSLWAKLKQRIKNLTVA